MDTLINVATSDDDQHQGMHENAVLDIDRVVDARHQLLVGGSLRVADQIDHRTLS